MATGAAVSVNEYATMDNAIRNCFSAGTEGMYRPGGRNAEQTNDLITFFLDLTFPDRDRSRDRDMRIIAAEHLGFLEPRQ